MKKYILFSSFLLGATLAFSQSRMVINDDAILVINNGAYLVIDNPSDNALSVSGAGGKIKSEAENNRVRWRIGATTGTYIVPFADDQSEGGTKIPLSFFIQTAGVGAGYVDFSTYDGPTWNNDTYKPSMVTSMGQYYAPGVANHSAKVIDRFWIMNPVGYTTKPETRLTFGYIDAEHSAAGNTMNEANMGAQRFNTTTNQWGDMLPIGTAYTASNIVLTPFISPANFYAAWTLSQISDPLSVQLLSFTANCVNQHVNLKWKTGSEQNSSHFQVVKSTDMESWETVCNIAAAGNSSVTNSYEFQETTATREITYYRLIEHDVNGGSEILSTVSSNCDGGNSYGVALYPNPNIGNFTVQIQSNEKLDGVVIQLYDLTGRLLKQNVWNVEAGVSEFSMSDLDLSAGSYVIRVDAKQQETQVIRFVVK